MKVRQDSSDSHSEFIGWMLTLYHYCTWFQSHYHRLALKDSQKLKVDLQREMVLLAAKPSQAVETITAFSQETLTGYCCCHDFLLSPFSLGSCFDRAKRQ